MRSRAAAPARRRPPAARPRRPGVELLFLVEEDPAGGYVARAAGASIFTQGETLAELRAMVRDAVRCHFPSPRARPRVLRLHFVRDEVLVP